MYNRFTEGAGVAADRLIISEDAFQKGQQVHVGYGLPPWVSWESVYFICSCILTLCGVIAFLGNLVTPFAFFDFIDSVYLLVFGFLGLALDSPYRYRLLDIARAAILRHFAFSAKITGRGLWLIFMSSIIHRSLWDNQVWIIGAVVFSLLVLAVGACSTAWGINLSCRINKTRSVVKARGDASSVFVSNARQAPTVGMSAVEFHGMLGSAAHNEYTPSEAQAVISAIVLADGARNFSLVTSKQFASWLNSGQMLVV